MMQLATELEGRPPRVGLRITCHRRTAVPSLAGGVKLARLVRDDPTGVETKVDVCALCVGDARRLARRKGDVPPQIFEQPAGSLRA